jgi:protein gp37
MVKNSKISWTDHSFNPWIGCTPVSAGCKFCYAKAQDERWNPGAHSWGKGQPRRRTKTWSDPAKWNRQAGIDGTRPRVFCASLSDWLDTEVPPIWGWELLGLVMATPNLRWLFLTKRHDQLLKFIIASPLRKNMRLGVTVENQENADVRLPVLWEALIHGWPTFVSYEPALGPVEWNDELLRGVQWLICGAESGKVRRPFDEDWARAARDACQARGIPFFFKQTYRDGKLVINPVLDGRRWMEYPE